MRDQKKCNSMIRKYICIVFSLILIFCFKNVCAQNLNVVYKAKSIAINDMLDNEIDLEYMTSLKINNRKSIYSRDSLILKSTYPNGSKEIWAKKNVYKDFDNDSYIIESSEFEDDQLYGTKISTFRTTKSYDWVLTNKSDIICDLICEKAVSGFDTIWYTIDLPYSDGPQYGVFNLPGLVLKYKTLYGVWEATTISYEKVDEIIIPKGKTSKSKNNIRLSYGEILKLSNKEAITVNDQLELNKYIRFEEK